MDLFFYIAIIGASMILFSKIQYKMIWDRSRYNGNALALNKTKKNNFFIKIKNSFLYELFYSQEFAKMNSRYGTPIRWIARAAAVSAPLAGAAQVWQAANAGQAAASPPLPCTQRR